MLAADVGLGLAGQDAPARRPQTPAERASERIRALQREAEALVAQESQLLVELRKLELERQIKVEELAALDKQQQDTSRQLNDAAARADALRKIADADRPDIEAAARPSLPARARRLLAAAARRRRPALARPRVPHRRGDDAPRSGAHPVPQADARRARRGAHDAAGAIEAARDPRGTGHEGAHRARSRGAEPHGARRLHRRAARSQRAVDERARSRAAAPADIGERARRQRRRPSHPSLPGRAALAGARRRSARASAASPAAASARPSSGTASRSASPKARPSGSSTRAWSRSPASSPATAISSSSSTASGAFSLYGHLSAIQTAQGERVEAQAPAGAFGPQPQRHPGAVLRAPRRRQAGRSLTMATERDSMTFKTRMSVLAALDAGPCVRSRRRPHGRGHARRAPASRRISICGCSTTWSTW